MKPVQGKMLLAAVHHHGLCPRLRLFHHFDSGGLELELAIKVDDWWLSLSVSLSAVRLSVQN